MEGTENVTSPARDVTAPAEQLCHPPCGQAITPCPQGDGCYKDGWVHERTMTHECPGSERRSAAGLVVYGPQCARPAG